MATVEGGIRASLTLSESSGSAVYDQTHEFEHGETVSLTDQFEPGRDYQFVVTIEEEPIFDRPIYHYESYELAIPSASTVEVVKHAEA